MCQGSHIANTKQGWIVERMEDGAGHYSRRLFRDVTLSKMVISRLPPTVALTVGSLTLSRCKERFRPSGAGGQPPAPNQTSKRKAAKLSP